MRLLDLLLDLELGVLGEGLVVGILERNERLLLDLWSRLSWRLLDLLRPWVDLGLRRQVQSGLLLRLRLLLRLIAAPV